METLKGILDFISSYPMWAKGIMSVNIACVAAILILGRAAPKAEAENPQPQRVGSKTYSLKIAKVQLYSDQRNHIFVQVTAIVNGIKFHYPSQGGVEWLEVGASMTSASFELPASNKYEVRFELRERFDDESSHFGSQETPSFSTTTADGTPLTTTGPQRYPLFRIHSGILKDNTVSGEVFYSIEAD